MTDAADAALEALRWNWGPAYTIGLDDGVWWFRRRDGWGGTVPADDPRALRDAIITNYVARPVRHDTPDAEARREAYEAAGVRIWHDAGGWHARWDANGTTPTGISHPHDLSALLDRLDALKGGAR